MKAFFLAANCTYRNGMQFTERECPAGVPEGSFIDININALSPSPSVSLSAQPTGSDIVIIIPTPSAAITDIGKLINAGITAAIVIAGLLAFVFLVWGGLQWLTSGGDKAKYEGARDRITAAIVGLAIVAVSVALINIIGKFFGIDIFNLKFPTALGS